MSDDSAAPATKKKHVPTRGRAWTDEETELLVRAWETVARDAPPGGGTTKTVTAQVHAQYLRDIYALAVATRTAEDMAVPPFDEFIQCDLHIPDGGVDVTNETFQPRSARSVEDRLAALRLTYLNIRDHDRDLESGQQTWFERSTTERTAALGTSRRTMISEQVYELLDRFLVKPSGASATTIRTNGSVSLASSPHSPMVGQKRLPSHQSDVLPRRTRRQRATNLQFSTSRPTESTELPRHAAAIWVDNANITRTRVVPTRRLEADPDFCVTLTNAVQGRAAMGDAPFEPPVGEVYLVPEATRTLHNVARWMPDTGAFFGDMLHDRSGEAEWPHCPRSFLGRQVVRLLEAHAIEPTLGFEMEFQILDKETLAPIDSALYCSMKAFHDGRAWTLLKDIVECLEDDLNIPVHQYHPESASGQLEISTGTFRVVDSRDAVIASEGIVGAVDKLVLARQTIYAMAAQRGFQATFVPKLQVGQAGNAAHVHIGLITAAGRKNLFATDPNVAQAFLAGILEELPALCMLLAPTVNSYDRLQPKCWAGAYQCYGYENREAPLRLVGPTSARVDFSDVDHFEVKTLDGTANPYLAVGAILAAGMSGIERNYKLPPPCTQDPATMVAPERPALLPRSLEDAIERFEGHRASLWNGVLSESYASLLVTLRRAELAHYSVLDPRDEVKELLKRY